MAELYDSRCAVRLARLRVSRPFGEDARVGSFVCVAVVDGCIEGTAKMVYIDLDVACPISRFVFILSGLLAAANRSG